MLYLTDFPRTPSPEDRISGHSEGRPWRGKAEAKLYRGFCNKDQVVGTSKHYCQLKETKGFPGGSVVKNLPVMQEMQGTRVWSLGQEGPLEEGMAAHSGILAWRIPWTEEPGRLQSIGSQRVRHDLATKERERLVHKVEKEVGRLNWLDHGTRRKIHTDIPFVLNPSSASHLTPPLYFVTEHLIWTASYSKFPLAIYFTYGNTCFHATV